MKLIRLIHFEHWTIDQYYVKDKDGSIEMPLEYLLKSCSLLLALHTLYIG